MEFGWQYVEYSLSKKKKILMNKTLILFHVFEDMDIAINDVNQNSNLLEILFYVCFK